MKIVTKIKYSNCELFDAYIDNTGLKRKSVIWGSDLNWDVKVE